MLSTPIADFKQNSSNTDFLSVLKLPLVRDLCVCMFFLFRSTTFKKEEDLDSLINEIFEEPNLDKKSFVS
jgi:hypothetical protein